MKLADQGEIDLIRASGLFDEPWYIERYPDVKMLGIDPVEHFAWIGSRLGRDPGPNFSTADYLERNKDVQRSGHIPLIHYHLHGKIEGRYAPPSKFAMFGAPDFVRDAKSAEEVKSFPDAKCVAVFACFSKTGKLAKYVEYYLRQLRTVCDKIVVVADNDFSKHDLETLGSIASHVIAKPHGEYDFGSYKRGFEHANKSGWLNDADELLLCNDSCVGPLFPIEQVFSSMRDAACDFWAITDNDQFQYHLQSYFVCLNRNVFSSDAFAGIINSVEKKDNVNEVIAEYEIGLTAKLRAAGFKAGVYSPFIPQIEGVAEQAFRFKLNYTKQLIDAGCPFVKTKALSLSRYNLEGVDQTLARIKEINPVLAEYIAREPDFSRYGSAKDVSFSIVMPMFNRAQKVKRAIESVIAQTHQKWELLMIDDGSTDETEAVVQPYLSDARIKYVKTEKNKGVSAARNVGLEMASGEFIAYLDSDNRLRPNFLAVFANVSVEFPNHKVFYSRFCRVSDGVVIGRPFDLPTLVQSNFIDLGTFVHHRSCYQVNGGFDESLKRLVDWDLVLKYTRKYYPVYISGVLMEYTDDEADEGRISVRENLLKAHVVVRSRHTGRPIVTTAIVSYNQEKYIAGTIEAAIRQSGDFIHEIIIADDGSTDETSKIAAKYASEYPRLIRLIGDNTNVGISENFKRCFREASGEFIAILEGDDIWNSDLNLDRKVKFLRDHKASMVFSKLGMMSEGNGGSGKVTFLERQLKLKSNILSGQDFIDDPDMNLIVNFSSCLFRTELMRQIPEELYTYRLSEIGVAFFLERFGGLGYLDEHLTTYRVHSEGVWSGLSLPEKLRSARKIREIVRDVANDKYHQKIDEVIEVKYNSHLRRLGEPL
ncbi:glycosyltransferase [Agrobacterium tumefaciens]|uniref:glycosyltransferase n=1 Tax=Agrobacterium tumefaciens TaxID=358 RepID=UPI003B9F1DCF